MNYCYLADSPVMIHRANICQQLVVNSGSSCVKSMESIKMGILRSLQPREAIGKMYSSIRCVLKNPLERHKRVIEELRLGQTNLLQHRVFRIDYRWLNYG